MADEESSIRIIMKVLNLITIINKNDYPDMHECELE